MQQMLEKELPPEEKQPQRKFIPWLWAAGFALMITVGWMLFLTSSRTSDSVGEFPKTATAVPPDFENNSIVKNTDSDVDNSLVETKKVTEIKKNEDLPTLDDRAKNETGKVDENLQLVGNQLFVKEKVLQSPSETYEKIENVIEISKNVENVSKYVDKSRKEKIDSIVAGNIHFDLKTSGYSKPEIELAKILSFRGSKLEVSFPRNLDAPEPVFAKAKKVKRVMKKAKPSIKLVAGATISFDPKINGFETGALINLPIKNSKWSFETGLNYRLSKQKILRLRWPLQRNITNSDSEALFLDPSGDNINEYYYQSPEQLGAFSSQNYHLLSVPLNLRYGFHSKWSVALGLNSSLVLNAFSGDLSVDDFNQNAFPSSEPFQKYDLAANVGVDFQATGRWSFHLKYNQGNLLKGKGDNVAWQINNQYFNVGTGFTF